ncbi:ferredoxin [Dactylosporangium sp. NPDC049525]|uniref:ferredoxin n=1 Tax=Dactylosporangium sp. NPDC049525 TaxID=3154730 RepID=UPI003440B958
MAFVITQGCVDIKDKTCLTVCPVDCIYEGERMTYIQPLECIDCGACAPQCPQDAIYYELDLPADRQEYARVNAEFFDDIGSPGSSSTVDLTDRDHETVRALPATPGGTHER